MISFKQAYSLTMEHIQPLPAEQVPLLEAVGRVSAAPLLSSVDSPTADVSLKDGYAVRSADIAQATTEQPCRLKLSGSLSAGGEAGETLQAGEAVRILSGARVPPGAEAVLAEEFTRLEGGEVVVFADAEPGRNILPLGADVKTGEVILQGGTRLQPNQIGLLAAGGLTTVPVVRRPRVAVLATGDEVLAPGEEMTEGKLYASNLVTLASWCQRFGLPPETHIVPDNKDAILQQIEQLANVSDSLLTSGGAWKGERDLVSGCLDELGWQKLYHRIRMGPGKAVGFGLYRDRPVFILPGGPPSNLMAFLQLVLPGLLRLAGWQNPPFPLVPARLSQPLSGQIDWTQFVYGRLTREDDSELLFTPLKQDSRLQVMANAGAIASIPEGVERLEAGQRIEVQQLDAF
jgi:molybdopterin molybdotransferase